MRRLAGLIAGLMLGLAAAGCQDGAHPGDARPNLIPRAELFGDPAKTAAALNPAGDMIAFLAPERGYLNVWVGPASAVDRARALTHDQTRGVRQFQWAETGAHILYLQDQNGDEAWRLNVVDVATGAVRDLTPVPGTRASIISASPGEPNIVIVAWNERDREWPDVYRIDLLTGERTLLERNTQRFAEYYADRANRVRLALKTLDDGSAEMWAKEGEAWRRLFAIPLDSTISTRFVSFEADENLFLMFDSINRNTAALVRVDLRTGDRTPLGESPRADVSDVWLHPLSRAPQAYAAEYLRREWRTLTPEAERDLDYLNDELDGEPRVMSRARDDALWIVKEEAGRIPGRWWLYNRSDPERRSLRLLFDERPTVTARTLPRMTPLEITSRDGLTLVSYLTLPAGSDADGDGSPDAPAPLVLVVHGGPWARDSFGFNPIHQWLADRGYAALSVNYRGSRGFGAGFMRAGNGEWGAKMQDDLADAVAWAVQRRIARPDAVAIMGQSYGGYAVLSGLAFTPEAYACGVSLSGPSDLVALLDSTPAHWAPFRAELFARVGDPRTDGARLAARSPIQQAGRVTRPLLMAHGARDPRVSRAEADAFAARLPGDRENLVYLMYPDEGHGLSRPQNRLSFYAAAENFLGVCLGGPAQPMTEDFAGASAQLAGGGAYIPGLSRLVREAARAETGRATTRSMRTPANGRAQSRSVEPDAGAPPPSRIYGPNEAGELPPAEPERTKGR